MAPEHLHALLQDAFPGAVIALQDTAGDRDHYTLHITHESFRGMNRVAQHRAVYAALQGRMGGELHAMAVQTAVPS